MISPKFVLFFALLGLPSFGGSAATKTAHLEVVSNLVYKEETELHCSTVQFQFEAMNETVLDLPAGWIQRSDARFGEVLREANTRIHEKITKRFPVAQGRFKRATGEEMNLLSFTGLAGFVFGGALISSAEGATARQENRAKEMENMHHFKSHVFATADRVADIYLQQLDAILSPANNHLLLKDERILKLIASFAGSGRVVDVQVQNFRQIPPRAGCLAEATASICFQTSASEYPLFKMSAGMKRRAHAGGEFNEKRDVYWSFSMAPFWINKRGQWEVVQKDECELKADLNVTICPTSAVQLADRCTPELFAKCPIIPTMPVSKPFTHAEPLINSWFIVTTDQVYKIEYANKTSETLQVPESGVMYVSASGDSTIVVGNRRLPGNGALHSIIPRAEILQLDGYFADEIEKKAEYVAAGEKERLQLKKVTAASRFASWLSANQLAVFVVSFAVLVTLIIAAVLVVRRYHGVLRTKFGQWTPVSSTY